MAAMTSFHTEKCRRLASKNEESAGRHGRHFEIMT